MNLDLCGLFVVPRGHDDLFDELAHLLEDLCAASESLLKILYVAPVLRGDRGVETDDAVFGVGAFEGSLERQPFGFERPEPVVDRGRRRAIDDGIDELFDLCLDDPEAALRAAGHRPIGRAALPELLDVGLHIEFDHVAVGEGAPQRLEHATFQLHARDGRAVVADAVFALPDAGETAIPHRRVGTAATAALDQPRKDEGRLAHVAGMRPGTSFLALLNPIEQTSINDRELGCLGALPLRFGIRPADALARRRVFQEALPVPHDLADVEAIVQDAVLPAGVAIDRRCGPGAAARRSDAVAIEGGSDLARGFARIVPLKDAHNGGSLGRLDDQLTCSGPAPVTVGPAATDEPFAHARALAASRLLRQVGEVELAQHALDPGMECRDLTVLHGHDGDVAKSEVAADGVHIGLMPGQAVDRLAQNHVELASGSAGQQAGEAPAVDDRSARQRFIGELSRDRDIVALRPCPAQGQLVGGRAVVLAVGRVPSVERGAFHCGRPFQLRRPGRHRAAP